MTNEAFDPTCISKGRVRIDADHCGVLAGRVGGISGRGRKFRPRTAINPNLIRVASRLWTKTTEGSIESDVTTDDEFTNGIGICTSSI